MKSYDVAVVGAGVMGAATAYSLATSGRSVLLLDQFDLKHNRGSSHGAARIFRFSYPDPMYVAMAQESLGLWREIEEKSGSTLIRATGGLDAGKGIELNASALEECGAQADMIDGAEASRRYPFLWFPPDTPVLFSPDSGVTAAEQSVGTFVALATAAGAELRERARVSALEESSEGIAVTLENGDSHSARAVVVTAGGWANKVLASVGIVLPIRPTRETVAYYDLGGVEPPTLVEWGEPTVYCLPDAGHGLKAGQHIAGPVTDPDEEGRPSAESVAIVSEWVRERWPTVSPEPTFAETCIYTNTDDQRFLLERHGRVVVGSPCSGHGFKFAPLVGRRLAALVDETLD